MARPITNRSNYFSQHHYGMLVVLAKQVLGMFDHRLDINELINVGWFRQARYYENVKGKAGRIKREMFNWAIHQKSPNNLRSLNSIDDDTIVLRLF